MCDSSALQGPIKTLATQAPLYCLLAKESNLLTLYMYNYFKLRKN